jgi:2-dehydropantoate 2-reductase
VTVVARGQRLADIRRYGLMLEDVVSGVRATIPVAAAERLPPDDQYDLGLITVRREQLADIIPALVRGTRIATVLFMLNNPTGSASLVAALGQERTLFGFPGAGGTLDGPWVRYAMVRQQPTTIGEYDGRQTERVRKVAEAFREAGFRTTISSCMDAWLKTHAFFVTAVSGAIYLADGDCRRLSEDNLTLTEMARGVREGFAAVRALGLPVTPFPLKVLFMWLPPGFAVRYWRQFLRSPMADLVLGRHARTAVREMREIAADCRSLLEKSGVEAPALQRLYRAIDAYAGR